MSERHTEEFSVEFDRPIGDVYWLERYRELSDRRLKEQVWDALSDGRRYVVQVGDWREEPVEGGTRHSRTAVVLLASCHHSEVGEFCVQEHDGDRISSGNRWESRTLAGGVCVWGRVA